MASNRKRTMTVDLVVEDKPARKSLRDIDRSTKQTADQFGKAGKAIKTAMTVVALGAVTKFAGDLADRAGMMEGIMRRVSQVFGDNASEVAAWAESSSAAFGESTTTLQGMAAEIGDLLVPIGLSREAAAEMAIETLNAANALSEWTGGKVTVVQAANAMAKAFLGEREQLKTLGISILEADVKARLLAKGQQDLTGNARKAAKAIASQELIFEQSADALQAYAEGGDSVIRSQKELKAAVSQAFDELALKMIPVFEKGFETAKDFAAGAQLIVGWFEALPGPVKQGVLALGGVYAALVLLSSQPIVAGLALVVAGIVKLGDSARNQRQAIDDMRTALQETGGSAEDAAVAFLEARDGGQELQLVAAELGVSLDDVAAAALGDEAAMGKVKSAFEKAKREGKLTFEQFSLITSEMTNIAESAPAAKREVELLAEAERVAGLESTNLGADLLILGTDMESTKGDTEDLTDAVTKLADEQRKAIDPIFALRAATGKYSDALDVVEGLQKDGKRNTDEYRDAVAKLIEAQGDLNFRTAAFDGSSEASIAALMELGRQAGLTEGEIRDLIRSIDDMNTTPILTGATGGIRNTPRTPGAQMVPTAQTARPQSSGTSIESLTVQIDATYDLADPAAARRFAVDVREELDRLNAEVA